MIAGSNRREAFNRRRALLSVALALSLAACGAATPSATPGPTPSPAGTEPSAAPSATSSATPSGRPSASASRRPAATPSPTFESQFYRYAITLPPGIQNLNWSGAERPWNGTAKLDRSVPYLDRTGIAEGGLFIFGAEAESLEAWFARVESNGVRYNGCTPAQHRVDVEINGVPAVGFAQQCTQGVNMARVAIWKDGWGIGVWLGEAPPNELPARRDRAIELLAGLEWRTD